MTSTKCSRFLVLTFSLLTVSATAQERLSGYYDNAITSPMERSHLADHRSYANVASNVRWWVESDWQIAEAAGLKVILPWPDEFFYGDPYFQGIDYNVALNWNRWMWYGNPGDTAVQWYYAVLRHRNQIAAFGLADERDCNYGTQFPNWTYASCAAMARKLEANAATIKTILRFHGWDVPVWINYTSAFAAYFQSANPTSYGASIPQSVDWVSFDAYTPWERCYGSISCPQLIAGLERNMRPDQRIVLVPRAFSGPYLGYHPSDMQVALTLLQYYQYMQADPRVVAMLPFSEFTVPGVGWWGASSSEVIHGTVRWIGQQITGRRD